MLGRRPIKWRQRPDMTIVADFDVKYEKCKWCKVSFDEYIIAAKQGHNSNTGPKIPYEKD